MPVVKLYARLRQLAGEKEVEIAGPDLGAVLTELVRRRPAVDQALFEDGRLRPHILITLNGLHATELDRPVGPQDVIAIFPPIAGG